MRYALAIAVATAAAVQPLAAQMPRPQGLEALWYTRGEESIAGFIARADQISIVSPQSFTLDSNGVIRGSVDPRIVSTARAKGVQLVPLVMNPGFDQPSIHRVLNVPVARQRALESLVAMCTDHKLDGIQFDIENFHVRDKDAFTSFARDAAPLLRAAGCTISAAVVPRTGEDRGPTSYHQWIWDNWRGGFDYKALSESLDFISYMTYAQHTGGSPPGPVAGFPWMEESLRYVLSLGVPPEKISLGIAGYSDWWYPVYDSAGGSRMRGSDISYTRGMEILAAAGVTPVWDDVQKSPFAMWENAGVFEHMWLEDARAFTSKLELVKKYGLRGYSVWKLGDEDPKTWALIKQTP